MTRDQALIIADRIMRRIEDDKAIHRDSLADEIEWMMGTTTQRPPGAAWGGGKLTLDAKAFIDAELRYRTLLEKIRGERKA